MSKFRYMRKKLSEKLELPEDMLGNSFRMQIIGACLILCGCKKLLKYKSEEIIALTADTVVTISGNQMKCVYFFEGTIEISGNFSNIAFENR